MKLYLKRIIATVLALLTIITFVFQNGANVFAASEKAKISFWYASVKPHEEITEYKSKHKGNILYAMIDGHSAYCMNFGLSATGGQLMKSGNSPKTELSKNQNKLLAYCMYYGYSTTKTVEPNNEQKCQFIATQAMVWNIVNGLWGSEDADSAATKLCKCAPDSKKAKAFYTRLNNNIANSYSAKRPSFSSNTQSGADTFELKWNESNKRFEYTFKDTNKVLENYDFSIDGFKVSKSGNSMTVYTKSVNTTATVGRFITNNGAVETTSSCVFWLTGKDGDQEFVSVKPTAEPISAYIKVKTESLGYGEIIKTDKSTGIHLAGAVYGIYSDSACTKLVDSMTTDNNGYAKSKALKAGTYYVKEISAPDGYVISDEVHTLIVEAGKTTGISLSDVEQLGSLTIYKEGEVLSDWDGSNFTYEKRKIAGATFKVTAGADIFKADGTKVFNNGDVITENLVSDTDGQVVLSDLYLGTYVVTEIKSIDGYTVNSTPQVVNIDYKDQNIILQSETTTVFNNRQKAEVTVMKKDSETDELLAGGEFTMYAACDIKNYDGKVIVENGTALETVTTEKDGTAKYSVDIPYGNSFCIKETKAPENYVRNDNDEYSFEFAGLGQDVEVADYSSVFLNSPTTVEFTKVDKISGAELSGATLSVIDKDGNVIEKWTTVAGEKHVIKRLKVGETYTLHEEVASKGYLRAEDISFTVEDTKEIQSVVMKDEVPTGSIIINKEGEFVTDNNDVSFNYAKKSLSGVTFEVYASEDIISCDGLDTVYFKKDNLVETITTDDNGIASVENLPLGKYYIVETETAEGFVLDSTPIEVDLTYVDQDTKVVYAGMDVSNERQKIKITVVKNDSDTKLPLAGVSFGLFAKEDIVNDEGKVIVAADERIENAVTGEDGKVTFVSDLPLGQYYVKEIEALEGYVKSDEIFYVDASYKGKDVAVNEFTAEFENTPIKVEFSKTDITGELEIAGAKLFVIDSEGNVVESWTSEAGKVHMIERLSAGNYTLREESAPYGYKIARDVEFEVTDTDEIQKVFMKDEYAVGKIVIEKTDEVTKKPINGVEFEIRDKDGKVIETVVTDRNGHAESKELPICNYNSDGSYKEDIHYYVVETKAANGYILDESVHDVVLQYEDKAPECVEYTLSITNKRTEEKLPQTGDNFNPWLFAGLGIGAVALGLLTALWKKKEDVV